MVSFSGSYGAQVDNLVTRINKSFPRSDHTNVGMCEALYPHARYCMELEPHVSSELLHWAIVMDKAAIYASF